MSAAKPKKSDIRKWIKALRSGKYKQTKGCLQDEKGYCCLGVACKVFAPNYTTDRSWRDDKEYLTGETPSVSRGAPEWLEKMLDVKFIVENSDGHDEADLVCLNDELDFSFDEIADVLQAIYVEEALS